MTNASRVPVIRFLFLGVLVLAPTLWAQKRSPISEQIAKTYGLDSFGQIERIRYTFNADSSDGKSNVLRLENASRTRLNRKVVSGVNSFNASAE